jgi:hypothetical protein
MSFDKQPGFVDLYGGRRAIPPPGFELESMLVQKFVLRLREIEEPVPLKTKQID